MIASSRVLASHSDPQRPHARDRPVPVVTDLPTLTRCAAPALAFSRTRHEEECQQKRELKDDLGLDHVEGRTYHGWAHHVVLTAVEFTFLQIERGRATVEPRPMLDRFRRNAPLRR
jgi:SRSO17 transposase